jgi:hypothetical protein
MLPQTLVQTRRKWQEWVNLKDPGPGLGNFMQDPVTVSVISRCKMGEIALLLN